MKELAPTAAEAMQVAEAAGPSLSGHWHYWVVIILMMIGLYIVIARDNLVKKVMGLAIFQVSVIMFYVAMGKMGDGTAPIFFTDGRDAAFSNPLPHVLMLTAIVVGIATTAVALALAIRIKEQYGTVEEDDISQLDREAP